MRLNSQRDLTLGRSGATVLIAALISMGAIPPATFADADQPAETPTLTLQAPAADKLPGQPPEPAPVVAEPDSPEPPAPARRKVQIVRDGDSAADFERRLARLERMIENIVSEGKGKKAFAFGPGAFPPDIHFDQKEFGKMRKEIDRATREADLAARRIQKIHPNINREIRIEGKLAGPHGKMQRKALEAQRKALEKQLQALDHRLESLPPEEDSADENEQDVIIRRQPDEIDFNDEDTDK